MVPRLNIIKGLLSLMLPHPRQGCQETGIHMLWFSKNDGLSLKLGQGPHEIWHLFHIERVREHETIL